MTDVGVYQKRTAVPIRPSIASLDLVNRKYPTTSPFAAASYFMSILFRWSPMTGHTTFNAALSTPIVYVISSTPMSATRCEPKQTGSL